MEGAYERPEQVLDWNELRTKLHLSPEPAIDPETVEIDQLHLSRLALVPIDRPRTTNACWRFFTSRRSGGCDG